MKLPCWTACWPVERHGRLLLGLACAGLVAAAGCATTDPRPGLTLQQQGDYLGAYAYFTNLATQHPADPDLRAYLNTARGLAFRQCIGRAEQFLKARRLDDFLDGMRQAQAIQSSDRVQEAIRLVEQARQNGQPADDIFDELCPQSLAAALAKLARDIQSQLQSGRLAAPLAVAGFSCAGKSTHPVAAYFEGALCEALLNEKLAVVERGRLKQILDEQKFSASRLADPEGAVEFGRLAGARTMVVGELYPLEPPRARYQLRLLDVESGKVVYQKSRDFLVDEGCARLLTPAAP